ncbi:MAG: hypothetical protein WC523_04410 [Patescibacteria group bacterium]
MMTKEELVRLAYFRMLSVEEKRRLRWFLTVDFLILKFIIRYEKDWWGDQVYKTIEKELLRK